MNRIWLFVALLILAFSRLILQWTAKQVEPCSVSTIGTHVELLVRLEEYGVLQEMQDLLESRIRQHWDGCRGSWSYGKRAQGAYRFPTDFLVMQVDSQVKERLVDVLRRFDFVKDIHPQRKYSEALKSVRESRASSTQTGRALRETPLTEGFHPARELDARSLWEKGYHGEGVKIGIFDTGIKLPHPAVGNVSERTNWTDEDTLEDRLGHGSFVAGMVGSTDPSCLGFAPNAEIHTFRVFTNKQISYTSWFLDAFNYAIATKMNIINLSIGGPDHMDAPFMDKVMEISANGIIMVSAIGNDGPHYGTLNNPADQSDVIGVGGLDRGKYIASFSSRGMTTWELPSGYGRVKPDIVTFGKDVVGAKITSGCRSLSGTSVASPVVAGAVALLASTVPLEKRWKTLNPASMKQALISGADIITHTPIFLQGAGKMNLKKSVEILKSYKPAVTVHPPELDFTRCPYMWPFCTQPFYADALPVLFNATILNALGVTGVLRQTPTWHPGNEGGGLLCVQFTYSEIIWPWSGYMAMAFSVAEKGKNFDGIAEGLISFQVVSPPALGESKDRSFNVTVPVKVKIIPTPPKDRRVLWDQYRNVQYPPAYIPRDTLEFKSDLLDWHGDHPHTNFHSLFDALRGNGYFLEVLGLPFTCVESSRYGTFIIADPEDEFHEAELQKIYSDVTEHGLGLLILGEWYNLDVIKSMKFYDENTRSWWSPYTGGANLPALNTLLAKFGVLLGDRILSGKLDFGMQSMRISSGSSLIRFPSGGHTIKTGMMKDVTLTTYKLSRPKADWHMMGFTTAGRGRLAVLGDTFCFDSDGTENCRWALPHLLKYTSEGILAPEIFNYTEPLNDTLDQTSIFEIPLPRVDLDFAEVSHIIGRECRCGIFKERTSCLDENAKQWVQRGVTKEMNSNMEGSGDVHMGMSHGTSMDTQGDRSQGVGGTERSVVNQTQGELTSGTRSKGYSKMSVVPTTGRPVVLDLSVSGRFLARLYGAFIALVAYASLRAYKRRKRRSRNYHNHP